MSTPRRPEPKPKFNVGDKVREKEKPTSYLLASKESFSRFNCFPSRGVGTVLRVIVKKNKRGSRIFHMEVEWETKSKCIHVQHRLMPAEE